MITSMTSRLDDWTSAGPLEPEYFLALRVLKQTEIGLKRTKLNSVEGKLSV